MTDQQPVGRIGWAPDYQQDALFPPAKRCQARGCEAGDRKNLCQHDAAIAHGTKDALATRPRGCLNSFDFMVPDDQPLPY